jgi:ABC-type microcin C transport system duplicated ATPase subunit YejF
MHLTYLFISHSMPLVRFLSTNIVVLQGGKVIETGPCEQICHSPKEVYTRTLLQATPELPARI